MVVCSAMAEDVRECTEMRGKAISDAGGFFFQ